jgi:hypothetical protein
LSKDAVQGISSLSKDAEREEASLFHSFLSIASSVRDHKPDWRDEEGCGLDEEGSGLDDEEGVREPKILSTRSLKLFSILSPPCNQRRWR